MRSKQRYPVSICSAILQELKAFRNYTSFSVIFLKILDATIIQRFERHMRIFHILLSITLIRIQKF